MIDVQSLSNKDFRIIDQLQGRVFDDLLHKL